MADPNDDTTILPASDSGAVVPAASSPRPTSTPAAAAQTYDTAEIRCEFCGSRVTRAKGEVLELGKRARTMRDVEVELEQAKTKIAQLETRIRELTPAPPAPREPLIRW